MPNLNKVLLAGHIGRDAEVKYTPSGAGCLRIIRVRPVGGDSGPDSPNVLKLHAEHSPAVEPPSSTFVHVVASEVAAGGACFMRSSATIAAWLSASFLLLPLPRPTRQRHRPTER